MSATGKTCERCGRPIYRDIQDVSFVSGHSPMHQLAMRIMAEWCSTPNCHERAEPYNSADHRGGDFTDEVCRVRDRLSIIADGLIQRGKRESQYDPEPSMRKVTLKDARMIAAAAVLKLNLAINKFNERIF